MPTKPKKKTTYEPIAEYIPVGRKRGIRFGTIFYQEPDGTITANLVMTPLQVGEDGNVYSVLDHMGKPANIVINAKKTKKFRELFEQTVNVGKARLARRNQD
jgi:hypothetical protein